MAPAARIASAASPAGAAHHAQPASQRGRGQGRGGRGASAHAGAAARAPAARAPAAAAADDGDSDDDDDEDPELTKLNYYNCGAAQATFNKRKTHEYITGGTASAMTSFTYTPPDPLKTGCARSDEAQRLARDASASLLAATPADLPAPHPGSATAAIAAVTNAAAAAAATAAVTAVTAAPQPTCVADDRDRADRADRDDRDDRDGHDRDRDDHDHDCNGRDSR